MKRLIGIAVLCFIAAVLYAMPPFPGSYPPHDGSQHPEITPVPFRSPSSHAVDSSMQKIAPLSPSAVENRKLLVILVGFNDKIFSVLGAGATDEDYRNYYLGLLQNNTYSMRRYYQDCR